MKIMPSDHKLKNLRNMLNNSASVFRSMKMATEIYSTSEENILNLEESLH